MQIESLSIANKKLSLNERRKKRDKKKQKKANDSNKGARQSSEVLADNRFSEILARNEDELLNFVAKVNKVYQEKLKKPAPFMTFVLCGMQSAGKSTIMERFMSAVLNIVQEGTGTRCPLDTTCIHDTSCSEPKCELSGLELDKKGGKELTMEQVFKMITEHNRMLAKEDRFSTEPLWLVYRADNVQNMRFVDTPGIISNKSTGKDNREDIKHILQAELRKPNTKLCVLLEPKEFATNPIIDFCDETFSGRKNWIENATFLMTKFDKQLDDSRTCSKANNFFIEFQKNECFPHLVITPTLAKEDLPTKELFEARKDLLLKADESEKLRFDEWESGHASFRDEYGEKELLNEDTKAKLGFVTAKKEMRQIMLQDTAKRLPEVLTNLREELDKCQKEMKMLTEKAKFNDPKELKLQVSNILYFIEARIKAYLDGDIECAIKFPEKLQDLESEIEFEEESEWADKDLNHFTENEDAWRTRIAEYEGEYPSHVQADQKFLGGKQVQRALEFFKLVMIRALPDPYDLKHIVANGTGYLGGNLQVENWERATVQIVRVCVKQVTHPGINYLIKHVGSIFRRLFLLALDDVKQGEQFSSVFKLMPTAVERYLNQEFDNMLWNLMKLAADKTHCSLEPMYATIDPTLPTFHANSLEKNVEDKEQLYVVNNGHYTAAPSKEQKKEETFVESLKKRLQAMASLSGKKAKEFLETESAARAKSSKSFLPDNRSSMINNHEIDIILQRSFEYIVALMEFNLITLRFQMHHYLYIEFKKSLSLAFKNKVVDEADWDTLVQQDPSIQARLTELQERIAALNDSLHEVQRMQRFM